MDKKLGESKKINATTVAVGVASTEYFIYS